MTAKTKDQARIVDDALELIAEYVCETDIKSENAYNMAKLSFADSIGCALLALKYPACEKMLGPIIEETYVPGGCRVPGTPHILDPINGAFNIGAMIRWLDFNDTWLAAEWGHPSDNLGGILAVCDYMSQKNPVKMRDVFTAMIKAYEIQGVIALQNSFNKLGFDHVILVKVATAAVVTHLLGGNKDQVIDTLSNAWIDTGPLRTYRHAPNTGSRKSWAAGDATARGVQLAMMTMKGEMGYPLGLCSEKWGFYDVITQGKPFVFERKMSSYVIENILFKISYPAEFHAQTAVEAAVRLHVEVKDCLDEIERIDVETTEASMRIINKTGPLYNPADRDHCLQYMIAIGLIYGTLSADHYEDAASKDPRIDKLRAMMYVVENTTFTREYMEANKRSIGNSLRVYFKDGTSTDKVSINDPIGHQRRRDEGVPLLFEKLQHNLESYFSQGQAEYMMELLQKGEALDEMAVHDLMSELCSKV